MVLALAGWGVASLFGGSRPTDATKAAASIGSTAPNDSHSGALSTSVPNPGAAVSSQPSTRSAQCGDIVGGCHCLHLFGRAARFVRRRDHLRGRLRDKFHHPSERVRDAVAVNQRRTHPAPDDDPTVRDQRCRLDVHDNGATDSSRPHLRVDHVGDRRAACRGFDDDQSGSGGDDSDDRRIGRSHRLLGCGRRSHHRHDPGDVIGSGPWACSGARPRSASLSRWSGLGDEDRES